MSCKSEELEEKYYHLVVKFVSSLKNGKIDGSGAIALATLSLLEKIISDIEYGSATELLWCVRAVGKHLLSALPTECVVGNMVRRVLRIIREEHNNAGKQFTMGDGEAGGASLQQLVRAAGPGGRRATLDLSSDVRAPTLDHIAETKLEIETSAENVASQAVEHIHANELILTFGSSRLVERFLRRAARDRPFHVILAEGPDCKRSHQMAVNLAKAKIEVTVVADCAVMAVMSRVNKVIIGAQAVLAGGGLRAVAGTHIVALAAKHYSVPVIVLSPLYKMCPVHLCEQDLFNTLVTPENALSYQTGSLVHETHVYNPLFDYVPPDLLTLFLTNLGGNSPSYIYRLLSELYDSSDYQL